MYLGMPKPYYFIEVARELGYLYYVPFYDNIQKSPTLLLFLWQKSAASFLSRH